MKSRIFFRLSIFFASMLLLFPMGLFCSTPADSDASSKTELLAQLAGFRSLLDHGQLIQALRVGYDAAQNEGLFDNSLYSVQESLLFEAAVAHLDYIDKILNLAQAKQCAAKAAALWKKYIDWYHKLDDEQRAKLVIDKHNRINMAVAHLGNALIRKGDIFGLFDEYSAVASMNVMYFGTDAILMWKNGLYGCPDGDVHKQHTSGTRRNSINNGCGEHWSLYVSTLKDWVDEASLRAGSKKTYLREIEQIEREING